MIPSHTLPPAAVAADPILFYSGTRRLAEPAASFPLHTHTHTHTRTWAAIVQPSATCYGATSWLANATPPQAELRTADIERLYLRTPVSSVAFFDFINSAVSTKHGARL